MLFLRDQTKKRRLSIAKFHILFSRIVNTLATGTVFSKRKLAALPLKITKNSSALAAVCILRMAGSTKIALPISESSINKTLRGAINFWFLNRLTSCTNGVAMAHKGTPAK